jgi:hypothetical protein
MLSGGISSRAAGLISILKKCLFRFFRDYIITAAGRPHDGTELDFLMIKDGRSLGVECKRADAPALTASMRSALTDLKLDRLIVVYPSINAIAPQIKYEIVRNASHDLPISQAKYFNKRVTEFFKE